MKKKIAKFDYEFDDFGDPVLQEMLRETKSFVFDACAGKGRMLTLSGPTEVGKTHLLKRTRAICNAAGGYFVNHPPDTPLVFYSAWKTLVRSFLEDPKNFYKAEKCGILIIEEFMSSREDMKINEFEKLSLEFAFDIANARVGKPTMFDTNKSIAEINARDERIASRMHRERGVFVDIPAETTPYLARSKWKKTK